MWWYVEAKVATGGSRDVTEASPLARNCGRSQNLPSSRLSAMREDKREKKKKVVSLGEGA